uniref:Reverse transcriptase Ty1/copia-type domain-containing protein n=1 Tax=Arundo donax TaxID=35708 RepID=A0A0A9DRI4_ARUDO
MRSYMIINVFTHDHLEAFDKVFAPVARLESVQLMITIAAHANWELHHLDIKSAFLNGDLHEEVYVEQPPGFTVKGKESLVYRLDKALYGLRQAPRAWNEKLDEVCSSSASIAATPSTASTLAATASGDSSSACMWMTWSSRAAIRRRSPNSRRR